MKSTLAFLVLTASLTATRAIWLTSDNWDVETNGKTVFVRFCTSSIANLGCRNLDTNWKDLTKEYDGDANVLIGDVNCSVESALCAKHAIAGYPVLKFGNPHDRLHQYSGPLDFGSLSAFAKTLKPRCSPKHLDFCNDAEKEKISVFESMDVADLKILIENEKKELETINKEIFERDDTCVNVTYTETNEKKSAVKEDLALMKDVLFSHDPTMEIL